MAAHYDLVHWTPFKKNYDLVILAGVLSFLLLFSGVSLLAHPTITIETLIIRATGSLSFLMLHIILAIGPLSRLNKLFLPLLYNRRHLGVSMFFISLIHGIFNLIQFHALGNINPIVSLFSSNTHFGSLNRFPFQALGFVALILLASMAATSHDFWLKNLGAKRWKMLHMTVYLAYALILMHVFLGIIQYEHSPVLVISLYLGMISLIVLHLLAALKTNREIKSSTVSMQSDPDGYLPVCSIDDIPDHRARMISLGNQKIAVFKYDHKISAVHNQCKHQHGPLSEGKIIDGCITCPWHGYQYLPHNGQSPAPFTEKVATYRVKIRGQQVFIHPEALPEGTPCTPASIHHEHNMA
jgi:nitrite reductase/ring-hydroxylating ferredoxin subunit/DMSO/TMAO reductase YedYZ heme-binding membrane subunit